jgi:membrane-associated phospholipid phosphatase
VRLRSWGQSLPSELETRLRWPGAEAGNPGRWRLSSGTKTGLLACTLLLSGFALGQAASPQAKEVVSGARDQATSIPLKTITSDTQTSDEEVSADAKRISLPSPQVSMAIESVSSDQSTAATQLAAAELPDAPRSSSANPENGLDANTFWPAPIQTIPPTRANYAVYAGNNVPVTVKGTPRRFLLDQKAIWTSPAHVRWHDAKWLIPLATATGLLIASDQHTMTDLIHTSPSGRHEASEVANAGVGVLAGIPALMFIGSNFTDAPHGRETSILSAEALADSLVVSEVLQYSTSRERPLVNNSRGLFFQGSGFSFPSNHSTAAWSLAAVLADEYPGVWSQLAAYTGATAVSMARVVGQQHFPSDVLVGSALGFLIGHYVYRSRHDASRTEEFRSADPRPYSPTGRPVAMPYTPGIATAAGGGQSAEAAGQNAATGATQAEDDQAAARLQAQTQTIQPRTDAAGSAGRATFTTGTVAGSPVTTQPLDQNSGTGTSAAVTVGESAAVTMYRPRPADEDPDKRGSVYVPMDSWVYPALTRLAGLGFVPSQSTLIRPWTRQECLRQVEEAEALITDQLVDRAGKANSTVEEGARMVGDLRREFARENEYFESLKLDSTYARDTTIAGHALMRSWDFGQTLDNDYGRPFVEGTNVISGASVAAVSGRFSFYVRDELQHSPGYSTYPQNVLDYIYGPSEGIDPVPLTGSINDVVRSRPLEMYAGVELGGYEFQFGKQEMYWGPTVDAPLAWSINAEPTYNFQLVSTRPHRLPGFLGDYGTWRVDLVMGKLSGHIHPARPWYNGQKITFNIGDNFEVGLTRWSIFAGVGSPLTLKNFLRNIFSFSSPLSGVDPGDRKSDVDFRWRLPGVRWITVYSDSYADDEPIPLDAPRRSVWMPGIYLSRIPGIPHVDFRFETPSTRMLAGDRGPVFQYINDHYVDANLNKNFFYGNSIGRDGRRYEGWTTYWFSGNTNLQFGYRQTQRSPLLLPGAGTQSDALMRSHVALGEHWSLGLFTQYERYYEPLLGGPQHNVTGQFELKWEPKGLKGTELAR